MRSTRRTQIRPPRQFSGFSLREALAALGRQDVLEKLPAGKNKQINSVKPAKECAALKGNG